MTRFVRHAANTASRFVVQLSCAFAIGAIANWLLIRWWQGQQPSSLLIGLTVLGIGALVISLSVGFYLLNRENWHLKQCAYDLHEINHVYRDALTRLFSVHFQQQQQQQRPSSDEFLLVEREVLNCVCAKIGSIFRNLTGRKCVITVKLLAQEGDQKFCFTWARSAHEIVREDQGMKFNVYTGENTGFDNALEPQDSAPYHFFAADLLTVPNYKNQRPGWQRLYRSTIVVPIQHVVRSQGESKSDILGFLCVDTRSPNRLNDTYHVQFVSAFADQMYNFMSIMRQKFLFRSEKEAAAAAHVSQPPQGTPGLAT